MIAAFHDSGYLASANFITMKKEKMIFRETKSGIGTDAKKRENRSLSPAFSSLFIDSLFCCQKFHIPEYYAVRYTIFPSDRFSSFDVMHTVLDRYPTSRESLFFSFSLMP